ncbi:MAG: FAD-dependent monooxygenase [Myxococcales bacterium]|nr:FAD-dependent monooxygenase [Myxococcales bacterium]
MENVTSMSRPRGARVLIVGAGIGGLTAGIALRRLGARVDIVERAPAFAPLGAGLTLQPNATAVLGALGVELRPEDVHPIGHVAMIGRDGRPLIEGEPDDEDIPHPSINIRRPDLHRALIEALGAPGVRLGRALRSLTPGPDGVDVEFEDGARGRWDLVIGADGVHSTVRACALGDAACATRYAGQTCWRFTAPAPEHVPVTTIERWSPGRRVGVVPLSRGGVYVYVVESAPAGTPGPGSADPSALRERFQGLDARLDALLRLLERDPDARVHHGDLVDQPHLSYGRGRVLLLGDAAHAMTPNMGQGAAMAIEDAAALALSWRETSPSELATRLRELRRARVAVVHKQSWRIGQVAHWRGPLRCWLRDALLRSVPARSLERGMRATWAPGIELAERLRDVMPPRADARPAA